MLKRLPLLFTIMILTHALLAAQDTPKERTSLIGTKFAEISPETLAKNLLFHYTLQENPCFALL